MNEPRDWKKGLTEKVLKIIEEADAERDRLEAAGKDNIAARDYVFLCQCGIVPDLTLSEEVKHVHVS